MDDKLKSQKSKVKSQKSKENAKSEKLKLQHGFVG